MSRVQAISHYLDRCFDNAAIIAAVEAGAEYIVTHNLRDFAGADRFGVTPISPGAFLRLLEATP